MNEQPDFLKAAEKAYDLSDELSARMDGAENADYFADNMMRSREWAMRGQSLALLSLAQDVRRVADALEAMQSTAALRVDLLS